MSSHQPDPSLCKSSQLLAKSCQASRTSWTQLSSSKRVSSTNLKEKSLGEVRGIFWILIQNIHCLCIKLVDGDHHHHHQHHSHPDPHHLHHHDGDHQHHHLHPHTFITVLEWGLWGNTWLLSDNGVALWDRLQSISFKISPQKATIHSAHCKVCDLVNIENEVLCENCWT